jgi:lipopolysaccharide/colanic/teichoic acid biosynthesis glycosyltransferase
MQMPDFYTRFGKRAFDFLVSSFLLILLSPVILIIAVMVRFRLGSPVLFRQSRPGRNGTAFVLLKFRSMSDSRDNEGTLLDDSQRLDSFGRFLRASSLDELPELVNVAKGEMSLVGPRPLLMQYLPQYSPEQARRHDVLPGLTGWAQVNGRNSISWARKFELDVWYLDHISFGLDVRILGRTLVNVLRRRGIAADGHDTMPPFS